MSAICRSNLAVNGVPGTYSATKPSSLSRTHRRLVASSRSVTCKHASSKRVPLDDCRRRVRSSRAGRASLALLIFIKARSFLFHFSNFLVRYRFRAVRSWSVPRKRLVISYLRVKSEARKDKGSTHSNFLWVGVSSPNILKRRLLRAAFDIS